MEIVRLVEAKVLLLAEDILKVLEGGTDYLSFESKLKKELDGLGCEILQVVLEGIEQKIRKSEDRKRNWTVVRKNDQKEILTLFGLLRYGRSYYRHKESKKYSYLLDEKVGITPHMRVGKNLKADLAEACTSMSYEEATLQVSRHNAQLKVSRQTAAKSVKEFTIKAAPQAKKKRSVPVIYVEADEDHLKIRGRRGAQARLIYIHEGIETNPRRHLKNPKYFTTVNKNPEEFWLEICDYIDSYYELSSIKKIFLCGDGAKWIRVGQEYIPEATYILDKFHLAKYIIKATAHVPALKLPIYREIRELNKQGVLAHLQQAVKQAFESARKKRINDTIKYIKNNWDGIESAVKNPHVGCSAEGHVSHILAARLSSRPMAWSEQGAEKMARMRAIKANGESVREHYLASQQSGSQINELNQEIKKELKRLKQRRLLGRENLNNIPLFNGVSNLTRKALKGLNEKSVI
jgi:hypothetical protein